MKWILVDNRISAAMERTFQKHGIYLLRLPPSPDLPNAISSHPDTLIFKHSSDLLTCCEYAECAVSVFSDVRELSHGLSLSFCDERFGKGYPADAVLNAKVIGNFLFANTKNISRSVLCIAEKYGLHVINVNQGYPNCAILSPDGSSAITADRGLYKALLRCGIDALLISEGYIELLPYEYGFIGGASAVVGDTVFFFGNLDSHPDSEAIREFIEARGKKCVSLSEERLTDLGGCVEI